VKIKNVRVYGLAESIIGSGYPMVTETPNEDTFNELAIILSLNKYKDELTEDAKEKIEKHFRRAKKLANTPLGSGHYTFLKGIIVQYDLTAPEYFWRQFDRYHFHDYVSSQSKMHRLIWFDLDKMCNPYVREDIKQILKEEISFYNKMLGSDKTPKEEKQKQFQRILSNCPMGIELTARITDNYLQLKSKYHQRRTHRLEEWQKYCDWIETLPMAEELIVGRD
jgi:hypothetical protein